MRGYVKSLEPQETGWLAGLRDSQISRALNTIRKRSENGAQLRVPSIVGIPDQFELRETANGERHNVTVIWRAVGEVRRRVTRLI